VNFAELPINELTDRILNACVEVHRNLGPGLVESAYETCLFHELSQRGMTCERQVPVTLEYKGLALQNAYRIDLLVGGRVILELKAVETLLPVHISRLRTYLRLSKITVGLLINFDAPILRGQIRRVVNGAVDLHSHRDGPKRMLDGRDDQ
jgi:GxxExxY protein